MARALRSVLFLVVVALVATGCTSDASPPVPEPPAAAPVEGGAAGADLDRSDIDELVAEAVLAEFGPTPESPEGALDQATQDAIDLYLSPLNLGEVGNRLDDVVASGDPRVAWILVDLLRLFQGDDTGNRLVDGFETLTGATIDQSQPWSSATNHLMAWDVPAPPGYLEYKRKIFLVVEPRWEPLFADNDRIDWRHVGWGGVRMDDRPEGSQDRCPRGCIPALDDPPVTDAAGGDWYPDELIVFGIVVNGEARAYPKNQMEVHEMFTDTLGGRRLGIPYCTLCGSAQAWYIDELLDADGAALTTNQLNDAELALPLLRTSGLLIRSNKMMFDLNSFSLVDTFTGEATSGPLAEAEVRLGAASVVTTTWGEWKQDHPDTTIIAEDGGLGRSYDLDPLGGRDDNGPIFPIGGVDPRLAVQAQVLGVLTDTGPIAFPVEETRAALADGERIIVDDIEVVADGGGLRAVDDSGADTGAHQAFWFAWSQFHPDTRIHQ